jgi:hypothetical protein
MQGQTRRNRSPCRHGRWVPGIFICSTGSGRRVTLWPPCDHRACHAHHMLWPALVVLHAPDAASMCVPGRAQCARMLDSGEGSKRTEVGHRPWLYTFYIYIWCDIFRGRMPSLQLSSLCKVKLGKGVEDRTSQLPIDFFSPWPLPVACDDRSPFHYKYWPVLPFCRPR